MRRLAAAWRARLLDGLHDEMNERADVRRSGPIRA
jgi:hypothetical protein